MKRKSTPKKFVAKKSKTNQVVTDHDSPPKRSTGSPERSILCVKNYHNIREIEEKEECFILDFDPYGKTVMSAKTSDDDDNDNDDVRVIGEKGQVACRDYPHPRHLCAKHKFETTPHESYCEQCYCFVCDVVAPCPLWSETFGGHCHATGEESWKTMRKIARGRRT